ncbi:hypothetical protein ALC62_04707 [Cyphomyrmex costatus]|uniref:Uncharacterized protein n=1 Tax=Cyphomyrmex costatus TaxID=456900 RepID=A0A195CUX3_9HYME|nr:hypothetical protein ALC62_04707 [Cyphomyrmex costatus]
MIRTKPLKSPTQSPSSAMASAYRAPSPTLSLPAYSSLTRGPTFAPYFLELPPFRLLSSSSCYRGLSARPTPFLCATSSAFI